MSNPPPDQNTAYPPAAVPRVRRLPMPAPPNVTVTLPPEILQGVYQVANLCGMEADTLAAHLLDATPAAVRKQLLGLARLARQIHTARWRAVNGGGEKPPLPALAPAPAESPATLTLPLAQEVNLWLAQLAHESGLDRATIARQRLLLTLSPQWLDALRAELWQIFTQPPPEVI